MSLWVFVPRAYYIVRTLFDEARYPNAVKREAVQKELIDRVAHLQGVEVVAAASHLPLSDSRQIGFRLEHAAPDDFHWAENSLVSPGYFRAMGISILRGRNFTEQDRPNTPLGRHHQRDAGAPVLSRAGSPRPAIPLGRSRPVHDCRHRRERAYFGPRRRSAAHDLPLDVPSADRHERAHGPDPAHGPRQRARPRASSREVQQQIWSLDRDLPVYKFSTFETLISESVAQRRFTTVLMLSFALIALALALIGLFGVMSYLVAQRQRELAIRMALGASRMEV